MKKLRVYIPAFLVIIAVGLSAVLCSCGCEPDTEEIIEETSAIPETVGDISVPINVRNSENIGSIDIVLNYDSGALEITGVTPGDLAQNAMMEYNMDSPGRVNIGIIDTDGISGDGSMAIIGFIVIDEAVICRLELESVKTHNATSLIDVINNTTDGIYRAEGNILEAPVINFDD